MEALPFLMNICGTEQQDKKATWKIIFRFRQVSTCNTHVVECVGSGATQGGKYPLLQRRAAIAVA